MGIGTSSSFAASANLTGFVANTPLNSAKPIAAATMIPAIALVISHHTVEGAVGVGNVVGGTDGVGVGGQMSPPWLVGLRPSSLFDALPAQNCKTLEMNFARLLLSPL